MKLTLWRSVREPHAAAALNGEGAAQFPGRYNSLGVRAVYLADCPAGCALELVAHYAAPEALRTQVLFEVGVEAALVDLRDPRVCKAYNVDRRVLVDPRDYAPARRVAEQLRKQRHPGAIVPSATVGAAFNVVIYPDLWNAFTVRGPQPLAVDGRVLGRLAT